MREGYQLDPALETQDDEDRQQYLEHRLRATVALAPFPAAKVLCVLGFGGGGGWFPSVPQVSARSRAVLARVERLAHDC